MTANDRNAVVFGAGNIGRGFIGQLFVDSGYRVTFVDVDAALVQNLQAKGGYRLQTVFNEDVAEHWIAPVQAVDGRDRDRVEKAVAGAELAATAVGAGALQHIARPLGGGIARREGATPLNVIVCENLKGGAAELRRLTAAELPGQKGLANVGLVDTVIGRMVPSPTPRMRQCDPGWIRAEPYRELPVDRAGFVGPVPSVGSMVAHDNFALFTARKLYIHNAGHAVLGYLGHLRGLEMGWQALADEHVRRVMTGAMREAAAAIAAAFDADAGWLAEHVEDLVVRFGNRPLGDPVFRLARDPLRKLRAEDRLVGAARLCEQQGLPARNLTYGIAAGLRFDAADDPAATQLQAMIRAQGVGDVLETVAGVSAASDLGRRILARYRQL